MGSIVRTTPGSYTVTIGVDTPAAALIGGSVVLEYWQGGAGGEGGKGVNNRGGGGGGYTRLDAYTVTDLMVLDLFVPSGGASNMQPGLGGISTGGEPVLYDDTFPDSDGTPGIPTGGIQRAGGAGYTDGVSAGGGGGSSAGPDSAGVAAVDAAGAIAPSGGGNGGTGGDVLENGSNGSSPGGGGGGAGGGAANGGTGGNGKIVVSWTLLPVVTGTNNGNRTFLGLGLTIYG